MQTDTIELTSKDKRCQKEPYKPDEGTAYEGSKYQQDKQGNLRLRAEELRQVTAFTPRAERAEDAAYHASTRSTRNDLLARMTQKIARPGPPAMRAHPRKPANAIYRALTTRSVQHSACAALPHLNCRSIGASLQPLSTCYALHVSLATVFQSRVSAQCLQVSS